MALSEQLDAKGRSGESPRGVGFEELVPGPGQRVPESPGPGLREGPVGSQGRVPGHEATADSRKREMEQVADFSEQQGFSCKTLALISPVGGAVLGSQSLEVKGQTYGHV